MEIKHVIYMGEREREWGGDDKRGREIRKRNWSWGYAMSPAQRPIDLIGGW